MAHTTNRLTEDELLTYRAELRGSIFRAIHKRLALLKATGVSQKSIASRLGMDEGQLSRQLKGEHDFRLETLSDLALALGCRISAALETLELNEGALQLAAGTDSSGAPDSTPQKQPFPNVRDTHMRLRDGKGILHELFVDTGGRLYVRFANVPSSLQCQFKITGSPSIVAKLEPAENGLLRLSGSVDLVQLREDCADDDGTIAVEFI